MSLAERVANILGVALPAAGLVVATVLLWESFAGPHALAIAAAMYALSGLGITVGYHRLLTHRAFETTRAVRATLAVLGSMALEGPVIKWVSNHRMHHTFTDEPGDPHSPHVTGGSGIVGAVRGLWHAHAGWMFGPSARRAAPDRYAPDLLADPTIRAIHRTFIVWALAGLALPFGLGLAVTGTLHGALVALLWGGPVRIFLVHHMTFAINSLCHFLGSRRFATDDQSRNVFWLAPLSFGESWHNNHHAFPTSARHGLGRFQVDPSALVIVGLERCGLAWDVVRVSPERRRRAALPGADAGG
jgi:stearoyl-CoA desaturase (delta-9 desaturase)